MPTPRLSARTRSGLLLATAVVVLTTLAVVDPAGVELISAGAEPVATTSTTSSTSTTTSSTSTSSTSTVPSTTSTTTVPDPTTSTDATAGLRLSDDLLGAIAGDFPDASLAQDGQVYLAYATNIETDAALLNVPVRASFDLSTWSEAIDALPVLPSWATRGSTWAPTVQRIGGVWVMYFTTRDVDSGLQCIGVATSATSAGPFVSSGDEPVACQTDLGGSIDPTIVVDSSGGTWLVWKSDGNCCGLTTSIWSAPIGAFGSITGTPVRLLAATKRWQHGVIENPSLVETDTGWVLLYSAGRWDDDTYATGFALCTDLASACTNASSTPLFDDVAGTYGGGGLSVTALDDGRLVAIWHAWSTNDPDAGRSAWLAELELV
jgi:arabinan endo-1,5-alpha-L-arabinosidase